MASSLVDAAKMVAIVMMHLVTTVLLSSCSNLGDFIDGEDVGASMSSDDDVGFAVDGGGGLQPCVDGYCADQQVCNAAGFCQELNDIPPQVERSFTVACEPGEEGCQCLSDATCVTGLVCYIGSCMSDSRRIELQEQYFVLDPPWEAGPLDDDLTTLQITAPDSASAERMDAGDLLLMDDHKTLRRVMWVERDGARALTVGTVSASLLELLALAGPLQRFSVIDGGADAHVQRGPEFGVREQGIEVEKLLSLADKSFDFGHDISLIGEGPFSVRVRDISVRFRGVVNARLSVPYGLFEATRLSLTEDGRNALLDGLFLEFYFDGDVAFGSELWIGLTSSTSDSVRFPTEPLLIPIPSVAFSLLGYSVGVSVALSVDLRLFSSGEISVSIPVSARMPVRMGVRYRERGWEEIVSNSRPEFNVGRIQPNLGAEIGARLTLEPSIVIGVGNQLNIGFGVHPWVHASMTIPDGNVVVVGNADLVAYGTALGERLEKRKDGIFGADISIYEGQVDCIDPDRNGYGIGNCSGVECVESDPGSRGDCGGVGVCSSECQLDHAGNGEMECEADRHEMFEYRKCIQIPGTNCGEWRDVSCSSVSYCREQRCSFGLNKPSIGFIGNVFRVGEVVPIRVRGSSVGAFVPVMMTCAADGVDASQPRERVYRGTAQRPEVNELDDWLFSEAGTHELTCELRPVEDATGLVERIVVPIRIQGRDSELSLAAPSVSGNRVSETEEPYGFRVNQSSRHQGEVQSISCTVTGAVASGRTLSGSFNGSATASMTTRFERSGPQFITCSVQTERAFSPPSDRFVLNVTGLEAAEPDAPLPGLPAPALLTPQSGATLPSLPAVLTWRAVSGATSYRVRVAASASQLLDVAPDGCPACLVNDATGSTQRALTNADGLSTGSTYYWTVRAGNAELAQGGEWAMARTFTLAGASPFCTPNTRECDGADVIQCNAEGTAWVTLQTCATGCVSGRCSNGQPAPTVSITPASGTRLVTTFTQSGQGFTPNGSFPCFVTNSAVQGAPIFDATADAQGRFTNSYAPAETAVGGDQEFWCIDAVLGESNHVHFVIEEPVGPVPTVTSVTPLAAYLEELTTFTVVGTDLPSTLSLYIADCDAMANTGRGANRQTFTCTPKWAIGSKAGEVKDRSGGDLLLPFTVEVSERNCWIEFTPGLQLWTPDFTAQTACVCADSPPDCHTLYEGRVTGLIGNQATMEFHKTPNNGGPSANVAYWVVVGESASPSCLDLAAFWERTTGTWTAGSGDLSVSGIDVWPSAADFAAAPPGETKNLFIITGAGGGGLEGERVFFQKQAIVFTKVCE